MRYLRTAPRQKLLVLLAGVVIAALGGTAIAVAASSGGPKPPPKRLAQAIHDALSGPRVQGITATIKFTNHLIDASALQGSDPLLSGATGRLWLSNNEQLRLELQSDSGAGDAQVVLNGRSLWVYEPSAKTVYEATLPPERTAQSHARHQGLPSVARIQSLLNRLLGHLNVSGAQPTNVAGQPAYTVQVSPRHDGGLLGSAQIAWDALHGVPLRFAVYARNSTSPVIELEATGITYGAVPASVFAISPPSTAKVVRVAQPSHKAGGTRKAEHARKGQEAEITGVAAVARKVHFKLNAPDKLVGLPRRSVTLLDWAGHPAALVTYGQNLGGVAVIEQSATAGGQGGVFGAHAKRGSGDRGSGLSLPSVSINGATGQELDTALGTMVSFTRNGVSYTVIGSIPPAAADAAARGL